MNSTYNKYDEDHACWISSNDDGLYCMKIDRVDNLVVDGKNRLYVLATGVSVNEIGEPDGNHATSGQIGAFIAEEVNGKTHIVATNPHIEMGSFGEAPTQWKFVQLGQDYWGWQVAEYDAHSGYSGTRYVELAPYGKTIRSMGWFAIEYAYERLCRLSTAKSVEEEINCVTSLKGTVRIDTNNKNAKIFPLVVTVSGKKEDEAVKQRDWLFKFDTKKWDYTMPAGYPMKDADF